MPNNWRSRYRVAADDLGIRPKRRGAGWQRLRSTCGLIAEWLRICHREGWLGSARTNRRSKTSRPEDWQLAGEDAANSLADVRAVIGLAAPYGKAAHALNDQFPDEPPSRIYARQRKAQEEAKKAAAEQAAAEKAAKKKKKKKKSGDASDRAHTAAAEQAAQPPPLPPPPADPDDTPF